MKTLEALNWLDELLKQEDMTQADLSRASGLDSGTISNIRNGKRRMGVDVAERIAKATHRKTQDILRMAGEIDDLPPDDPRFDRIETLYNTLEKEDNKQRALDFLVFLKGLEDKNDKDGKKHHPSRASHPHPARLKRTASLGQWLATASNKGVLKWSRCG